MLGAAWHFIAIFQHFTVATTYTGGILDWRRDTLPHHGARFLFFVALGVITLTRYRKLAWYICKPESACPSCGYPRVDEVPPAEPGSGGMNDSLTPGRCPECGERAIESDG